MHSKIELVSRNEFIDSVINDDLKKATLFVEQNKNKPEELNGKDFWGRYALFEAFRWGSIKVLSYLLEQPLLDLGVSNAHGQTILLYVLGLDLKVRANSIGENRLKFILNLLAHPKVRVDDKYPDNNTALHIVCKLGYPELVTALLKKSTKHINAVNNDGETPLLGVVKSSNKYSKDESEDNLNIISQLLAIDAIDPSVCDFQGKSALEYAVSGNDNGLLPLAYDNPPIILALVKHPKTDINIIVKHYGLTVLMYVLEINYRDELYLAIKDELIANENSDLNLVDSHKQTVLQRATNKMATKTAVNLANHPRTNPNSKDYAGRTALMSAAVHNYSPIVQALLENPKTLVNLTDNQHQSALLLAVKEPHEHGLGIEYSKTVIQLLLEHPMLIVDLADNEGKTPLFHAVRIANSAYYPKMRDDAKKIITLLLMAGADPNHQNNENESALSIVKDSIIKQVLQNQSYNGANRFFPAASDTELEKEVPELPQLN